MKIRRTLNHRKWLGYLVIGSVLIYFIARIIITHDPYQEDVKSFLLKSEAVQVRVGSIESIKLTRVITVHRTYNQPAYRLYYLDVHGGHENAIVVVQVNEIDEASGMKFRIKSLKIE